MKQPLPEPAGALVAAGTASDLFALRSPDAAPTEGAGGRHPPPAFLAGAPGNHRSHHFGNDVAGAAHDDVVSDADVFAVDLVFVVEGRPRHVDTTHEHRLQHCEGGGGAGAADVDVDLEQLRDLLLGRKLVGDGPAGRLGGEAQGSLLGEGIHLHHHAVGLIVAGVTGILRGRHIGPHLVQVSYRTRLGVGAEPQLGEILHRLPMPLQGGASLDVAQLVDPDGERPAGRHCRVLLAHRAGGGIAGVGEEALPRLRLAGVELLEGGQGEVHLPSHLHQPGRLTEDAQRDRIDGAEIGGDVLPGDAVPTGGTPGQ